jgi:hypothetical protein
MKIFFPKVLHENEQLRLSARKSEAPAPSLTFKMKQILLSKSFNNF